MTIKLITEVKEKGKIIETRERTLKPGDIVVCFTTAFKEEQKGINWEGWTNMKIISDDKMELRRQGEKLDTFRENAINNSESFGYYWFKPKADLNPIEKISFLLRGKSAEATFSWSLSKER